MIRTVVVGAFAASLFASVAPTAQAQSLSNIFNCNRTGSNQTAGALIGGALGGLAGAGVAKNDTLGGILGAVVGAAAGSYIGCSMGERDQASLEDATLRALNEGRSTDWSNPQTGAQARINVYADTSTPQYGAGYGQGGYNNSYNAPRYGDRLSTQNLRFGSRVNTSASFETVAPRQVATTDTFIRMSPNLRAQTNGSLRSGEQFEAMAKVVGQPWLLVGRNGVGVGYVPTAGARASGETVTSDYGYAQPISAQSLRLGRGVSRANAYESVPGLYTMRSTGNLRAGPSPQTRRLGRVSRGSQVEALARVQGTPWILVGRNGQGIGYVSDTLLQAQAGYQQPGYGQPSYSPGYGQPGYTQASNDCRIVEQVVTTREQGTQTARLRACWGPNGGWTFAQA